MLLTALIQVAVIGVLGGVVIERWKRGSQPVGSAAPALPADPAAPPTLTSSPAPAGFPPSPIAAAPSAPPAPEPLPGLQQSGGASNPAPVAAAPPARPPGWDGRYPQVLPQHPDAPRGTAILRYYNWVRDREWERRKLENRANNILTRWERLARDPSGADALFRVAQSLERETRRFSKEFPQAKPPVPAECRALDGYYFQFASLWVDGFLELAAGAGRPNPTFSTTRPQELARAVNAFNKELLHLERTAGDPGPQLLHPRGGFPGVSL